MDLPYSPPVWFNAPPAVCVAAYLDMYGLVMIAPAKPVALPRSSAEASSRNVGLPTNKSIANPILVTTKNDFMATPLRPKLANLSNETS